MVAVTALGTVVRISRPSSMRTIRALLVSPSSTDSVLSASCPVTRSSETALPMLAFWIKPLLYNGCRITSASLAETPPWSPSLERVQEVDPSCYRLWPMVVPSATLFSPTPSLLRHTCLCNMVTRTGFPRNHTTLSLLKPDVFRLPLTVARPLPSSNV